jgi:DNA (cytosine-5)-methyltransferase 1
MATKTEKKFTFIDLFAGIGGMRLGFEAAGGTCLLTSDIDDLALKTYALNYKPEHDHVYMGDIFDIKKSKVPAHDVLVGGFPCQPYSIAGLRQGLADTRGQVFMEIIRILKESKPKAFLLENVKGLLSHDKGETFKYLIKLLEKQGCHTRYQVLNSMTHSNVPQNRERVFIVGFRDKASSDAFNFPSEMKLTNTIHTCLEKGTIAPKYYYDARFGSYAEIKKGVTSSDTLYQWRRGYVRENKSKVCPTITSNAGSGGHNVALVLTPQGIRKLTPRECANFQGFPKSFKFPEGMSDNHLYHQFGNSVTVPLIARVAKEIAKVL